MSKTKILADLVLKLTADKGEFNKGLNEVNSSLKAAGKNAQNAGKTIVDSFKEMSGATANVRELQQAIRTLSRTSFKGKTPEEIREINSEIGRLRDEMMDLRVQQDAYGLEFGAAMAQGLQTMTAIAEVGVGVASMFGANKEQTEKYQKAMVSLIGVTQALGVIENAIQQKQLMTISIKIRETAATIKQTIATKAQTVATVIQTAVQKTFNIAIGTTVAIVGAVVLGVAALTAGIYLLIKAFKKETEEQKRLRIEKESQLKIDEEAARLQADELVNLNLTKKALNDKKTSVEGVKKIIGELNEKYKTNISTEGDLSTAIGEANGHISNRISLLTLEAKAIASRNILIKAQEEQLLALAKYESADRDRRAIGGIKANDAAEEAYDNLVIKNKELATATNMATLSQENLQKELDKLSTSGNKGGNKSDNKIDNKGGNDINVGPYQTLINELSILEKKQKDVLASGGVIPQSDIDKIYKLKAQIKEIDDLLKNIELRNTGGLVNVNTDSLEAEISESIDSLQIDPIPIKLDLLPEVPTDSFNGILEQVGNLSGAMTGFFDQEKGEYKAFATAQALIATYLAAAQIMANQAKLGPIAMGISMAATIATGLANVAKIQSFAQGGIVYGETFARVGEYPNARSNPEVIAPLDKLRNIIGQQSISTGDVEFIIRGDKLVGVLNNYNKKITASR